ncbi:hypothetical protein [cf. Phormidesmis sp. LEGE 11477]|uniref:hypothetical protein n=1 Tax=cf. Phormidesmis sp. LEGE 11477 TaxID=1828680 RepID=UPI00187DFBC4|nr:hypothetical protein [cf. Phormidesmis sp. LEGE 11477]MBE9064883.1 hypothetical protein [cf. Phormidesmis sp. LEGE 11477]
MSLPVATAIVVQLFFYGSAIAPFFVAFMLIGHGQLYPAERSGVVQFWSILGNTRSTK